MLFLYVGPEHTSPTWLPSTLRLPEDEYQGHVPSQITYHDGDGDDDLTVTDQVSRLNADSQLASRVESGRRL